MMWLRIVYFDDVSTGEIEDETWEESLRGEFALKYLLGTDADDGVLGSARGSEVA